MLNADQASELVDGLGEKPGLGMEGGIQPASQPGTPFSCNSNTFSTSFLPKSFCVIPSFVDYLPTHLLLQSVFDNPDHALTLLLVGFLFLLGFFCF